MHSEAAAGWPVSNRGVIDDRAKQLLRHGHISLIGCATVFAVHLPTGIEHDGPRRRVRIKQPHGRNGVWRAVTAVPCTKLGPGSGGRGLLARANSSLTSEKPRVDRHQPPQSADAIRQEQIEWRVAAAVADIRALIAREEVEHRINVFAWCREDAHRVQVEGATGRP